MSRCDRQSLLEYNSLAILWNWELEILLRILFFPKCVSLIPPKIGYFCSLLRTALCLLSVLYLMRNKNIDIFLKRCFLRNCFVKTVFLQICFVKICLVRNFVGKLFRDYQFGQRKEILQRMLQPRPFGLIVIFFLIVWD